MATQLPDQTAAIAACRQTIARQPEDIEAHERLAQLYLDSGNLHEAANLYLKSGALYYAQRKPDDALACWRKAIAAHPQNIPAHLNIGKILREQGKTSAAIAAYRKAASLDPNSAVAYSNLSSLYFSKGSLDEARQACLKRLELKPGSPDATESLAMILERQGNIQEAYQLLLPFIKAGTDHPGLARVYAMTCQRLDPPSAEAVPLLQQLLNRPDLAPEHRKQILMALAKLCDALDRYEEAITYLQQARAMEPEEEAQGERAVAQHIITESGKAYTAERLARLPHANHGSELPVFVVGMPRSGTTLTEHILSCHPQVFGAGELKHIAKLSVEALGKKQPYPDCLDQLTQDSVNRIAALYLNQVRPLAPAATRIVDKMPFNFQHLGLIQLLFPKARVIHCTRFPLDTCVSVYFNDINNMTANRNLTSLGNYYRDYWEQMQHWQKVLSIPIFTLPYEAMVAEPEQTIRKLVEFCGLEWNDACLKFYDSKRFVSTLSYHQVRQPIYTRSVNRYKAYEPWLGPLKAALGDSLDQYPGA